MSFFSYCYKNNFATFFERNRSGKNQDVLLGGGEVRRNLCRGAGNLSGPKANMFAKEGWDKRRGNAYKK
jgi:hypothetical protein